MLILATTSAAAPVDQESAWFQASSFALTHLPGKTVSTKKTPIRADGQATYIQQATPYYIFELDGGEGGFVIVSGDDRTEPILGYSDNGCPDTDGMPSNLQALLDEYAIAISRLDSISKQSPDRPFNGIEYQTFDSIGPLLTTKWHQNSPYSILCPRINKESCLTGCVATAMAQIMNHHKWPARTTRTIPAYTSNYEGVILDLDSIPVTPIDWNNMRDVYSRFTRSRSDTAVANLMMLCGHASRMGYGTESSGAFETICTSAFTRFFGYDEQTVNLLARQNYNYADWRRIIYTELAGNRPVLYCGEGSPGGHAFVCDGYKGNEDFFHINWGWGGYCDGYFRLTLLDPYNKESTDIYSGFGSRQTAIIGIQPDYSGTNRQTEWNEIMEIQEMSVLENKYTYYREGSNIHFPPFSVMYSCYSYYKPNDICKGFSLIDAGGNTVQTFDDPLVQNLYLEFGWYTLPEEACPITVRSSLPDGTYRLVATSRVSGTDRTIPDERSNNIFIELEICGDTLNILTRNQAHNLLLNSHTIEGGLLTDSTQTVTLHFASNGYDFHREISYLVDDYYESGNIGFLELGAEKSAIMKFTYRTSTPGPHTFTFIAGSNYTPIASFTAVFSKKKSDDPTVVGETLIGQGDIIQSDDAVYDLNGNTVGTVSQLPSLPHGIYIAKGVKVLK